MTDEISYSNVLKNIGMAFNRLFTLSVIAGHGGDDRHEAAAFPTVYPPESRIVRVPAPRPVKNVKDFQNRERVYDEERHEPPRLVPPRGPPERHTFPRERPRGNKYKPPQILQNPLLERHTEP